MQYSMHVVRKKSQKVAYLLVQEESKKAEWLMGRHQGMDMTGTDVVSVPATPCIVLSTCAYSSTLMGHFHTPAERVFCW